MQLAAPSTLRLPVDQGWALRQQGLHLAAAVDHSGKLEQLSEPDRVLANGNLFNHCGNVARGLWLL